MRLITTRRFSALAVSSICVSSMCAALCTACTTSGSAAAKAPSTPAASSFTPSPSAPPSSAISSPVASPAPVTSPAPVDTAAAASASASASAMVVLGAIALQDDDLPDWTGADYQPNPNDAADTAALLACVSERSTEPDKIAEAHSQDYSLDDATIGSDANLFRSPADITTDVAVLHSPKISRCYNAIIRGDLANTLPDGTTVNSVSFVITPGSGGGPRNVVARGSGRINVTTGGQIINLYLNVAFITGPLIEAEVDFQDIGAPVPLATRTALIAKVAARAALGQAIATSGAPSPSSAGKPATFANVAFVARELHDLV